VLALGQSTRCQLIVDAGRRSVHISSRNRHREAVTLFDATEGVSPMRVRRLLRASDCCGVGVPKARTSYRARTRNCDEGGV